MRGPIVTRSRLDAPPEAVWARAATFEGINDEFGGLLRMTAPREVRERGLDAVVPGRRLCRSWLLLFGVIPIDYDDITVVRLDPSRGFLERSPMASQRFWEHERLVEPDGDGCVVTDRVLHDPKIPLGGRLQSAVFRQVFKHRHRRLRKRFGARKIVNPLRERDR